MHICGVYQHLFRLTLPLDVTALPWMPLSQPSCSLRSPQANVPGLQAVEGTFRAAVGMLAGDREDVGWGIFCLSQLSVVSRMSPVATPQTVTSVLLLVMKYGCGGG